jgi:uncharacterized short protein YbdD (DUF466 family)
MSADQARVGFCAGRRGTRWREALMAFWRKAVATARLAIGVPDYDAYVAHMRAHHPGARVMNYAEFFNDCQARRYRNGRTGCC